jgi:Holliday junction resolvase-like predicted endonuclease
VDPKHKGSLSEHHAIAWLLENDWEVFKNVSPHGRVDLIAKKGTDLRLVDVTTGQRRFDTRYVSKQKYARIGADITHVLTVYYEPLEVEWHTDNPGLPVRKMARSESNKKRIEARRAFLAGKATGVQASPVDAVEVPQNPHNPLFLTPT